MASSNFLNKFRTNLDSVYGRPPTTLGGAIDRLVEDAEYDSDGVIESVKHRQEKLVEIICALVNFLPWDVQKSLAQEIGVDLVD